MESIDTPGVDAAAVTAWLTAHTPALRAPLHFTAITGGRSNLTYAVTDADGVRAVLRRPPLGHREGNAHDVVREAQILTRLAPTAVPVPPVLAVCTDSAVTGAPFFVMAHVDGAVFRTAAELTAATDAPARRRLGLGLAEVLAGLHTVDLDTAGWGHRAGQTGYFPRQLDRWSANWRADRIRDLDDIAVAADTLTRAVPPQRRTTVVHGDFRLDNCLIGPAQQVVGVLDWELATVGDPLADLGQFLVYWAEPGDPVTALDAPPTLVDGLPSRTELTAHYLSCLPTDVPAPTPAEIDFSVAFNWWKTACIVENVYTRISRGAMGATDRSAASFGAQAERLAAEARRRADALT